MVDIIITIASLFLPLLVGFGIYKAGENRGKSRKIAEVLKQDLEAIDNANKVENRVTALSDDAVVDQLRDRWTR